MPTIPAGSEAVLRISSNLRDNSRFFTDSNGLSLISRARPLRKSSISAFFFPITAMIGVENQENSMFLFTDRAQGATSLQEGGLEAIFQRRLRFSDNRGLAEPLNETETFILKNQLLFEKTDSEFRRKLQYRNDHEPLVFLGVLKEKPSIFAKNEAKKLSFSEIEEEFPWKVPEIVRIYLEDWDEERFSARFMNNSEKDEKIVEIFEEFQEKALNGAENVKKQRLFWNQRKETSFSQENTGKIGNFL